MKPIFRHAPGVRRNLIFKKVFDWFDADGDEDSQTSIVLRISLTEGMITDHERKYGDCQYDVDFINKTAI